jgi:hypothetical protein
MDYHIDFTHDDKHIIMKEFCSKQMYEHIVKWLYLKLARTMYNRNDCKKTSEDAKKQVVCEHYTKIRKIFTHFILNSYEGGSNIFPAKLKDENYEQFIKDIVYTRDKNIKVTTIKSLLNDEFKNEFEKQLASCRLAVSSNEDDITLYKFSVSEYIQSNGATVRQYELVPKACCYDYVVIDEFTDLNDFLKTHEKSAYFEYAVALTLRYNYMGPQHIVSIVELDDILSLYSVKCHNSSKLLLYGSSIFNYENEVEWFGYFHTYEKYFGSLGQSGIYDERICKNKHIVICHYFDEIELNASLSKSYTALKKYKINGVYIIHPNWKDAHYMTTYANINKDIDICGTEKTIEVRTYIITDENTQNNSYKDSNNVPSSGPYGTPIKKIVKPKINIIKLGS